MKTFECLKCATLWSDPDWKLKIVYIESVDDITQLYFYVLLSIINVNKKLVALLTFLQLERCGG